MAIEAKLVGGFSSNRLVRGLLCIAYTILLAVLSLLPKTSLDRIPRFFPGEDKVAHFLAYGFYALLLLWGLGVRRNGPRWVWVAIVTAACTTYGVLLELLQAALPQVGRAFSFSDMAANAAGALVCSTAVARRSALPDQSGRSPP